MADSLHEQRGPGLYVRIEDGRWVPYADPDADDAAEAMEPGTRLVYVPMSARSHVEMVVRDTEDLASA